MAAKTIGLLGGSFDPPHMGHVLLATVGLVAHGLDEVWLVPCRRHPFQKPLTSFQERVAMCRLATEALGERARVEPIEGELGPEDEPSYTVDIVRALQARHPDVVFRLLIGSDLVVEMDQWHRVDELRRLVEPLVVPRMGHETTAAGQAPETLPALSSTAVRERAAAGLPLDGWVPHAVARHIRERGLYRAGP